MKSSFSVRRIYFSVNLQYKFRVILMKKKKTIMEFSCASKRRSWDGMYLTSLGGCSWPHMSWCGVPLAGVPLSW